MRRPEGSPFDHRPRRASWRGAALVVAASIGGLGLAAGAASPRRASAGPPSDAGAPLLIIDAGPTPDGQRLLPPPPRRIKPRGPRQTPPATPPPPQPTRPRAADASRPTLRR